MHFQFTQTFAHFQEYAYYLLPKTQCGRTMVLCYFLCWASCLGWSGGAMLLGKLPIPRHPTNLDYSRARAYCACSRCGWGCLDIFLFCIISFFFFPLPLWEAARYRLKYGLKGPLNPKQPTNQLGVMLTS